MKYLTPNVLLAVLILAIPTPTDAGQYTISTLGDYQVRSLPFGLATSINDVITGTDYSYGMTGSSIGSTGRNFASTSLSVTAFATGNSFYIPQGLTQSVAEDTVTITGGTGTGVLRLSTKTVGSDFDDGVLKGVVIGEGITTTSRTFEFGQQIKVGAAATVAFGTIPLNGLNNNRGGGSLSATSFASYEVFDSTGTVPIQTATMTSVLDNYVYPLDLLKPGWESIFDNMVTVQPSGASISAILFADGRISEADAARLLGVDHFAVISKFRFPPDLKVYVKDEIANTFEEVTGQTLIDPLVGASPQRYYMLEGPSGIPRRMTLQPGFEDSLPYYFGEDPNKVGQLGHMSTAPSGSIFSDEPIIPISLAGNRGYWEWETEVVGVGPDNQPVTIPGKRKSFRWKSDGRTATLVGYTARVPGSPLPSDFEGGVFDVQMIDQEATSAGDYNQDGFVDAADYIVWRDTMGQSGFGLAADGTGNGEVDTSDHGVWRRHFGVTVPATGSVQLSVPEPAGLLVLAFGAFTFSARQYRAAVTQQAANLRRN